MSFTSKVSEDGNFLRMRNTIKEITLRFFLTQQHLGTEIFVLLGNAPSPRENHAPTLTPHDLIMFRFLQTWRQAQLTVNLLALEPHHGLACSPFRGASTDCMAYWRAPGVYPRENHGWENGGRSTGRLASHVHTVTTHPNYPKTLKAFLSLYFLRNIEMVNIWSLSFILILWWLIPGSGLRLMYKQRPWQSDPTEDQHPPCPSLLFHGHSKFFQYLLAFVHLIIVYHPWQLLQSPTL